MRVVIADDSLIMRDQLRQRMRALGHEVVGIAKEGEQCIALCAQHLPDVVIIDISMVPVGGQQAALAIKEAGTANYIVLATSQGQNAARKFAKQHGFGFSVKPYWEDKLRRSIEDAVRAASERTS